MTGSDNEYILEAVGLHKSYGTGQAGEHVLRGLDLRCGRGEFLAVMGPSGCGKSTLLHCLGLMCAADAGAVIVAGRDTTGMGESGRARMRRRRIGFVFQRFNLLGVLNGYDNIALSLRIRGISDSGRTRETLDAMGIADVARRKPHQMSIGQQQRLAVARAIVHKPDLLLADEPTGSLDSENAEALLDIFLRANRRDGQTIVMITHSAAVAGVADRIVQMKDGRILDGNS